MMHIADDIAEHTEQRLRNIEHALQQADCSMADIVRVRYIVPLAAEFELCWPVLRRFLGEVRPAATMFSAERADPRMRIEIEATARRRAPPQGN